MQSHFHQLLFHVHKERPLDFIFFPILTHVPSFVKHAVDHASCPIVAGTPDVMKAAFTKEQDFFGTRNIRYLDPALSFSEPVRMKRRLFEVFGELLGVTEDESDFAADEGLRALERFDLDVQARGRAILEQVEAEDRLAILLIGRPYHLDPGLHHGIPDEFQLQGYPILTIRSIPKDETWLARFFARDLASGRSQSPLDINDVWPENYSANSAMKVWATKFAARHPNVVLLDLSSFKCGHDAPTYGIIDRIVEQSALPHLALHDIDANKPGGSIKIRVKTYVHSLKLQQERLEVVARKKAELGPLVGRSALERAQVHASRLVARTSALATQDARQLLSSLRKVAPYLPAVAKWAGTEGLSMLPALSEQAQAGLRRWLAPSPDQRREIERAEAPAPERDMGNIVQLRSRGSKAQVASTGASVNA